jgi:uncharacterized LabA/DUF88 family protein
VEKHRLYVKALGLVGVKPIFGAFRKKDLKCRVCKKYYNTHEENQTEVNIAIKLFETAIDDEWDTAMIISGDSDLIPSILAVKKSFPDKQICVVVPPARSAVELKNIADTSNKIKLKQLVSSQFDEEIRIKEEQVLRKPSSW